MNYAIKTHIGRRAHNEDRGHIPSGQDALPFVAVSDGMGGHAAGEIASRMTIDGMLEELRHGYDIYPISLL